VILNFAMKFLWCQMVLLLLIAFSRGYRNLKGLANIFLCVLFSSKFVNVEKFNNVPSLCFVKIVGLFFQICWVMAHGSFSRVTSFFHMCYFGFLIC
jgi:hypothetical protein